MNKLLISVIFVISMYANKVFDISEKDYVLYLQDKTNMMSVFKNRFLDKRIKKDNNVLKNILITGKPKKIIKKKEKRVVKIIKIKIYSKNELLNKLNIENIKKEKRLSVLYVSIEKILTKRNTQYNIKEIRDIIKMINKNQLSEFESKLYLDQISQFIKGN